ncbi:MAG: hypothetical protein WCN98_11565 [Verrucomicrobiaceae bacterium]
MKASFSLGVLAGTICLTAGGLSYLRDGSSRSGVATAKSPSSKASAAAGKGFNGGIHESQSGSRRQKRRTADDGPSFVHSHIDLAQYENLVDELASQGIPLSIAREIVEARLHEDCNDQRAELLSQETIPYWSHGYSLDEAKLAEFKAIDYAERDANVQLFGLEAVTSDTTDQWSNELAIRFGGPLSSKREEFMQVLGRFAREREALIHQGDESDEERDSTVAMAKLEREMDQELGKVLTPTEREQYDLRNSPSANAVRSSLRDKQISVTEHEFRELYHARRKLDEALIEAAERGTDTGAAYEFYLANASRVLGPERMTLLD